MAEDKENEDFFAPKNVFKIMMGADGHGGIIGSLRKDLKEFGEKAEALDRRLEKFDEKFEKYDGLHEEHLGLANTVADHLEQCRRIQEAKETTKMLEEETAKAYQTGLEQATEKGATEAKETIKYTVWLIVKVLTALSITAGLFGWLIGLWG